MLFGEPSPDLSRMTKRNLLKYAELVGVGGVNSTMNKVDIISTIQAETK